jgi:hypothetical protein
MLVRPPSDGDDLRCLARHHNCQWSLVVNVERFIVEPIGIDGVAGKDDAGTNDVFEFSYERSAH